MGLKDEKRDDMSFFYNNEENVSRYLNGFLHFTVGIFIIALFFGCMVFNDCKISVSSGIWTALASEFHSGLLYRPVISDIGYGGVRYFPLLILLQSWMMAVTKDVFYAGHLLTIIASALLILGVYSLGKNCRLPNKMSWILALSVLTGRPMWEAIFDIRADIMPVAFSVWSILFILKKGTTRQVTIYSLISGVLLGLAIVSKPTSVMYIAVIIVVGLLNKKLLQGFAIAMISVFTSGSILVAVNMFSAGRFIESFSCCALSGSHGLEIMKGFFSTMRLTLSHQQPASLFLFIVSITIMVTAFRKRYPKDLIYVATVIIVFMGTVVLMGSPGTDFNHLIDWYVFSILLIPIWLSHSNKYYPKLALLSLAILFLLGTASIFRITLSTYSDDLSKNRQDVIRRLLAEGVHDPIVSPDDIIDLKINQFPYVLDPTMYGVICRNNPSLSQKMVDGIKNEKFPAIVVYKIHAFKTERPEGPLGFRELHMLHQLPEFKAHYRVWFSNDDFVVYHPY